MLGRGLTKFLPRGLRGAIGSVMQNRRLNNPVDIRKYRAPRQFSGEHVGVAGLFSTTTGLGRAAELVALTLERNGHRVSRIDLTEALKLKVTRPRQNSLRPADCDGMPISDVVFVINPDHPIISTFDQAWLLKRCIIGHWIWEIEELPWYWPLALVSYDEVWAPTDLVLDAIRKKTKDYHGAMRVVPYAIDCDPMPKISNDRRATVRKQLRNQDKFVVGYSFAVDSNYYRKNPEDAVRVFKRAFPSIDDRSVQLLLRCNDFAHRPKERALLQRVIGSDPRIQVLDASNRIGILDFYASLDVYLSTSRAEGYGLNLVEASQSGLPVISCGWRLPPEILALPNIRATGFDIVKIIDPQGHYAAIENAKWSAPIVEEMASILKNEYVKLTNHNLLHAVNETDIGRHREP